MRQFFPFLVITIFVGNGFGFLMNSTYETGTYGYQYLVGLIMDEKMSRHQLESRIGNLEQAYMETTKELQKDKNNRQQLIDENTRLNAKLTNATVDLDKLESRFEKLHLDYNSLKRDLENLTVSNTNLNKDTNNLTATQSLLEKKVLNLTKEQDELSSKYHILLEQYLAVTSHNQDIYIEKQAFAAELTKFDNQLLDMNSNISAQLDHIRQDMKENGIQLGFSLREVNKASSAGRLKFTTPFFNRENMFNMSRGEFVCKHAGLYFFIATIVREPGTTQSYCFIRVNDSQDLQGTVGYGSSTNGYASGTTALVYHLNVGDKVFLAGCHGQDHMHLTSSFSGFLIVPD